MATETLETAALIATADVEKPTPADNPYYVVLTNVPTDGLESELNGLRLRRYHVRDINRRGNTDAWDVVAYSIRYDNPLSQLHAIRKQLERLGNIAIDNHKATQTKKTKKGEPTEEPNELKASA